MQSCGQTCIRNLPRKPEGSLEDEHILSYCESLWKDHPLISGQEPKDLVEHLLVSMIHRGFSSANICQVMALT